MLHARDLHALFRAAYAGGGGRVDTFDMWWPALRDDPEYDSALVFLALDDAGRMIGGAQCWTSAFVKDLAVAEVWRCKGVGKALLMNAFACFRLRRAAFVDLKAEADHPSGAAGFYRRLGMVELA